MGEPAHTRVQDLRHDTCDESSAKYGSEKASDDPNGGLTKQAPFILYPCGIHDGHCGNGDDGENAPGSLGSVQEEIPPQKREIDRSRGGNVCREMWQGRVGS